MKGKKELAEGIGEARLGRVYREVERYSRRNSLCKVSETRRSMYVRNGRCYFVVGHG
jgi:hypothetical protein